MSSRRNGVFVLHYIQAVMVFLEILAFFPQCFMALRGGGRVIYTHFFYFSARFGCFSGHLALWQWGKYGKIV